MNERLFVIVLLNNHIITYPIFNFVDRTVYYILAIAIAWLLVQDALVFLFYICFTRVNTLKEFTS